MMRKKSNFTTVTPIPSFIPRQLAIDMLHSHEEVINTNPLVTGIERTKPPRDAPADEFYSTWYEITESIQFVPGIGKMGAGKIAFKGVFHDMPWGLQTHTYLPAGIDMRNKWQICGNQPGEPIVTPELGIGAPAEGLYLREDIEIKCNITMVSYVKKGMQAASKVMVDRMIKKAELLDAGVLHAMFEDGKLKTVNPADNHNPVPATPATSRPLSAGPSPYQNPLRSPTMPPQGYGQHSGQHPGQYPAQYQQQQPQGYGPGPSQSNEVIMELPGDFQYAQQPSPGHGGHLQPPRYDRYSASSQPSSHSPGIDEGAWSDAHSQASSRPTSYTSNGVKSPGYDQSSFAAELPTHQESDERNSRNSQPQRPNPNYDDKGFEAGQQYQQQQQQQQRQPSPNPRRSDPNTQKWQEVQTDRKRDQRMIFP